MKKITKLKSLILTVCTYTYASVVYADLPTAMVSDKANSGDYVGMGSDQIGSGIALAVQVVGALILLGAAWAGISSFMEVQNKKATWADFGKTIGGGLLACTVGIILITQAKAIFG